MSVAAATPAVKNKSVTVLLSLFKEGAYLQDQLDSIGAQIGVDWNLLWRDDTPADLASTSLTMHRFSLAFPTKVAKAPGEHSGHLGIGPSFFSLLAQVSADTEFVAFSDQDDVWLPDKLNRAITFLSKIPPEIPALYCSRQQLVDRNLVPLGLSPLPKRPLNFHNAIVQNVATGCTVLLNKSAREAILRITAPSTTWHDWWSYIVVTALGGKVIYDPVPTILYRQHEANSVGAEHSMLKRALRALVRGPHGFLQILSDHLEALNPYAGELPAINSNLIEILMPTHRAQLQNRIKILLGSKIYRQRLAEDLLLRAWLLMPPPISDCSRIAPAESDSCRSNAA